METKKKNVLMTSDFNSWRGGILVVALVGAPCSRRHSDGQLLAAVVVHLTGVFVAFAFAVGSELV